MSSIKDNLSIKKLFESAYNNYQKGDLKKAEILFKKVLDDIPQHFSSIFLLGTISAQLKKYQIAEKLLKKAIEIDPKFSEVHNNLGNVFQEVGNNEEAILNYQEAIKINPEYSQAFFNLGRSYQNLEKENEAILNYQEAIKINPDYAEAQNNLGNVFHKIGKYEEAILCYQRAIKINPIYAEAYYNFGNVFREVGKHEEAILNYQEAIKINPDYAEAQNNLGNVFHEIGKHEEAILCYQRAIKINPAYVKTYDNLGKIYKNLSNPTEAIKCFDQAIQINNNSLSSYWLSMNTFPIIYKDSQQINFYSKKFEENIKKINNILDLNFKFSKKEIINTLKSSTNFFLHYQGKDNLKLQKKYGLLIERLTKKIYPDFYKHKKIDNSSKFIKIGFISSLFKKHSVTKTHKNLILKLDKNLFKIYIYYVGNKFDETTNLIKNNAHNFFSNQNIDQLINKISDDALDALIFLDIGMDPKMQILGSLRLAPIQCNTWGHPITSGLKNIDYFLSSKLMEKKDSQKHYSEKLINLPNIGIDYDQTDTSNILKLNILKKSKNIIFFNLQSLFKLLPEDDHIYLDIIKKLPNSCFWFIQGEKTSITSIFEERINILFKKNKLMYKKYFVFHPRGNLTEFLKLIYKSDIILDSFNWSGCNTSLDAISLNKPIVTYPSNFMRGRHTYSFLKMMNIEDTIAKSKKNYLEIVVKLSNDAKFRKSIIDKICKNKNKLFNDKQPVKFLEQFLLKNLRKK